MVLIGLVLAISSNYLLNTHPLIRLLATVDAAIFGVVLAGMGTGVGGILPDFKAENAAKVSASFGGLVYMTLAVLTLFVVITLQAYPTFRLYDALAFSGKLGEKTPRR